MFFDLQVYTYIYISALYVLIKMMDLFFYKIVFNIINFILSIHYSYLIVRSDIPIVTLEIILTPTSVQCY